jgi:hypothetical protein
LRHALIDLNCKNRAIDVCELFIYKKTRDQVMETITGSHHHEQAFAQPIRSFVVRFVIQLHLPKRLCPQLSNSTQ